MRIDRNMLAQNYSTRSDDELLALQASADLTDLTLEVLET